MTWGLVVGLGAVVAVLELVRRVNAGEEGGGRERRWKRRRSRGFEESG